MCPTTVQIPDPVTPATEVARQYIEAWNSRSPAAIAEKFGAEGTYTDPVTNGPLSGAAIAQFAEGLFKAFPDLEFEITSNVETAAGVVLEWIMTGTNTGSLRGLLPPTGKKIALPGVDVIRVSDGRIGTLRGYFDRQTMMEQLGLQVVVQPHQAGPVSFGVSTRVRSGNTATPGGLALTMIDARTDDEVQEIRTYARRIMLGMPSMPGFLSVSGVVVGRRLYTVSGWTTPEQAHQIMANEEHREATSAMFRENLGTGFHSSIWAPVRIGPRWRRCQSCSRMLTEEDETCACGAKLPELEPYW
ncbi:MAG TPA: ester cyclase [Gemmatimonadales bacterium]|nr:ester cyclase [Gemmatimonadales bacterium]